MTFLVRADIAGLGGPLSAWLRRVFASAWVVLAIALGGFGCTALKSADDRGYASPPRDGGVDGAACPVVRPVSQAVSDLSEDDVHARSLGVWGFCSGEEIMSKGPLYFLWNGAMGLEFRDEYGTWVFHYLYLSGSHLVRDQSLAGSGQVSFVGCDNGKCDLALNADDGVSNDVIRMQFWENPDAFRDYGGRDLYDFVRVGPRGVAGPMRDLDANAVVPSNVSSADAADVAAAAIADAAQDAVTRQAGLESTVDAGAAPIGPKEVCRAEWSQPAGTDVPKMQLTVAPNGEVYFSVTYTAAEGSTLNLGAFSPAAPAGFVIGKLDSGCHLQWVRSFALSQANAPNYGPQALGTDAASNVTAAGAWRGSIDLGAGLVSSAPSSDAGFLLRLDPHGNTVFAKTFVTQQVDALGSLLLAVTPDGAMTLALVAGSDTDFGSGPDGDTDGGMHEYLVQFDPAAALTFRKRIGAIDSSIATIDGQTQSIWGLATNPSRSLWGTGYSDGPSPGFAFTTELTSSGNEVWLQQEDAGTANVAVGKSNQVVIQSAVGDSTSDSIAEHLRARSSGGSLAWDHTSSFVPRSSNFGDLLLLSEGPDDNPVAAGYFWGTITMGLAGPLTSAGDGDIELEWFGTDGGVRSQQRWGGPDEEWVFGLGVDAEDNIVFAGTTSKLPVIAANVVPGYTEQIYVVKVAP
jgi:hypothetical protein